MKKFMSLAVLFFVGTAFGAEGQNNRLERMNIVGLPVVIVEEVAPQVNNRPNVQMRIARRPNHVNPWGRRVVNINFEDQIYPIADNEHGQEGVQS